MCKPIDLEDYAEPRCLLKMGGQEEGCAVTAVPAGRITEKANEYFSRNDYAGAERHFLYWLSEAKAVKDKRGEFTVCNELMGLYRKTGKREEALKAVSRIVELISELGIERTVSAGTAYLNAGTVYKAFGMAETALPYFERALKIYNDSLSEGNALFGGLFNNMALCLTDLKRFSEAREKYLSALSVMEKVPGGQVDMAITHLNIADLTEAEKGLEEGAEEISARLEAAERLLDDPALPRDGYYAFVCEKCAPSFGYYGYFAFEEELKRRSKEIYERA